MTSPEIGEMNDYLFSKGSGDIHKVNMGDRDKEQLSSLSSLDDQEKKIETSPVCMLQVTGECTSTDWLPYYGWFDDSQLGGPKASTKRACAKRMNQWRNSCGNHSQVEMHFNASHTFQTVLAPSAICKFKIQGNCLTYPSLSNSGWFSDDSKGGPAATTWWNCRTRQTTWQRDCGSEATVKIKFDGPGAPLPRKEDGSLEVFDIDGATITLKPTNLKQNQSCFTMTRNPSVPAVTAVNFCYPAINIAGHPKAGTSFLQHVLKAHPKVEQAHTWKEYCRVRNNGQVVSYFRYFYGLAKATKESGNEGILANACINPEEVMEFDVLLQGPKALSVYLVRDAASRSWATYNFWCDPNFDKECMGGRWANPGVHLRSPELFHEEIASTILQNTPKKLLIPNHGEISNLYTNYIHKFETKTSSKHLLVIASEQMKKNLVNVWSVLAGELKSRTNYEIGDHPKIAHLGETRVNSGNGKGEGIVSIVDSSREDGMYAQSNFRPMLNETAELLTSWWDECDELRNRTSWPYSCHPTGYKKAKKFQPVVRDAAMEDVYITLWLHQVHSWFKDEEGQSTATKVRNFLQDAKNSGFTAVMGDIPWAWTEREARGDIRIDTFHKSWMEIACDIGLSLHVVITMREFPPWVDNAEYSEVSSEGHNCPGGKQTTGPSIAHPDVWQMVLDYTQSTTVLLLNKYGKCVKSISPTLNNEFETRYAQTFDMMRDYSSYAENLYKQWQAEKGLCPSPHDAVKPPAVQCGPICDPIIRDDVWQWLGFREEFLAERYIHLCKAIKESSEFMDGSKLEVNCLLHIAEIFASTDLLNSNLFFKLAKSEFVDELVMDSNMALNGAPSSPSIVGIVVSTAQAYGKTIHYEAATERVLPCNDRGQMKVAASRTKDEGAPLLLQSGLKNALEAGVHSIGITNLCVPSASGDLFSFQNEAVADGIAGLSRASLFEPSAVLYVPYRVFFAWSFVVSGITCGTKPTPCWHGSFDKIEFFGRARLDRRPGMCPSDVAQNGLMEAWDDLRTRHRQVAVIGDHSELTEKLLKKAKERVIVRFPCVMENNTWHFYEGDEAFRSFQEKSTAYYFEERHVDMPGKCPISPVA